MNFTLEVLRSSSLILSLTLGVYISGYSLASLADDMTSRGPMTSVLSESGSSQTPALRSLCTDRPTNSISPCTVDVGHFQVETDLLDGSSQRRHGVTTDLYTAVAPTIKYGLYDNLDLEASFTPFLGVRTKDYASPDHTISGVGDLYLRGKYSLWGQGASATNPWALAIAPWVKLPIAKEAFARQGVTNRVVEEGLIVPLSYRYNDTISFSTVPEVDAYKNSLNDGHHDNWIDASTVNVALPKGVTVSGELWFDFNQDPHKTTHQASFDLALAWQIGDNFQWDIGTNIGLNRETPDAELYVGVSNRF